MATVLAVTQQLALVGRTLAEVEDEIERGWIAAVSGYREIRDRDLWRQGPYQDFDAYCRDRWTLQRDAVDKMIQAFAVVETLRKNFPHLVPPSNEGQARALVPLQDDPDAMAAALEEARAQARSDDAKLTAHRIRAAVNRRLPEHPKADAAEPAAEEDAPSVLFWGARDGLLALRDAAQAQANRFGLKHHPENLTLSELQEVGSRVQAAAEAVGRVGTLLDGIPSGRMAIRRSLAGSPAPLRPQHRVILEALEQHGRLTSKELAPLTDIPVYILSGRLSEMARQGLIARTGQKRGGAFEYVHVTRNRLGVLIGPSFAGEGTGGLP